MQFVVIIIQMSAILYTDCSKWKINFWISITFLLTLFYHFAMFYVSAYGRAKTEKKNKLSWDAKKILLPNCGLRDDFTDITVLGKTHWNALVNFKFILFFHVILHKLYCQIAIIYQLHCVKYRNFTWFPGVKILWKGHSFRLVSGDSP